MRGSAGRALLPVLGVLVLVGIVAVASTGSTPSGTTDEPAPGRHPPRHVLHPRAARPDPRGRAARVRAHAAKGDRAGDRLGPLPAHERLDVSRARARVRGRRLLPAHRLRLDFRGGANEVVDLGSSTASVRPAEGTPGTGPSTSPSSRGSRCSSWSRSRCSGSPRTCSPRGAGSEPAGVREPGGRARRRDARGHARRPPRRAGPAARGDRRLRPPRAGARVLRPPPSAGGDRGGVRRPDPRPARGRPRARPRPHRPLRDGEVLPAPGGRADAGAGDRRARRDPGRAARARGARLEDPDEAVSPPAEQAAAS